MHEGHCAGLVGPAENVQVVQVVMQLVKQGALLKTLFSFWPHLNKLGRAKVGNQ